MAEKKIRLWYFRFLSNFFNVDMANMENVPLYGDKFIVTLLKLYALSLENNGVIIYEKREPTENYTMFLAKLCGVDVEIMSMALSYYISHGFLEIEEEINGNRVCVHAPYVKNNTGKTSKASEERRIRRLKSEQRKQEALQVGNGSMLSEGNPAEELAAYKDGQYYGLFKNVYITADEYQILSDKYSNADSVIDELSIYYRSQSKNRYDDDFAGLLKFAKEHGIPRVEETKKNLRLIEKWEREARAGFEPPEEAREVLSAEEFERISELAKKG